MTAGSLVGPAFRIGAAVLGAVGGLGGALCLCVVAHGYAEVGRSHDMDTFWAFVAASVVPLALGRALALSVQGPLAWCAAIPAAGIGALLAVPSAMFGAIGVGAPRDPYLTHSLEAAVWYLVFGVVANAGAVLLEGLAALFLGSHRPAAVLTVLAVNLAQLLGATVLVMAAAWPANKDPWWGALAVAAPFVGVGAAAIVGTAAGVAEVLRGSTRAGT